MIEIGVDEKDIIEKKSSMSWLTPQLVDSIAKLLASPAFISRTTIRLSVEELEYLLRKGYIKLGANGEPKIINKKKVIGLAKKGDIWADEKETK